MTPALQSVDSLPIGLRRLPTELLYHIVRLAASTDYKTAHTCAYVSKTVCKWTAPDRWRTIIITTGRQFEALWYLLEDQRRYAIRGLQDRKYLSLPSWSLASQEGILWITRPGEFVENLFVDTQCPQYMRLKQGMQVGTQVTPHDSVGAYAFLDYFKHLNYLAVGPNEIADFDLSRGVRPRKILITSDSEDVLRRCLNDIAYSGTLAGIPSNVLHDGLWIPSWNSSCTRLRSLHIISMNQHSELTGAPMPVSELEQLRSGSLAEHSLIQCHQLPPGEEGSQGYSAVKIESGLGENTYSRIPVNQSTQDRFWTEHGQGSTNIRYDTRKFSFRPCEITASRLRPFFEELTTTFAREVDERNRAQAFSHKGPRHAAPRRGAGNFSSSSKNEEFDGGEVTAKRAVLGLFGCNKFRKLHLCWDPMPTGTQDLSHDDPGTRLNGRNQGRASTKSAGETDWPVERQDIWTNTSSQNNEAKAPPPHTFSKGQPISAQKRSIPRANGINQSPEKDSAVRKKPLPSWVIPSAMESTQSKAFRADMVDAFRTTIGWTRHDQELLKDTEWFIRGASLNDDSLDPLDNFISEYHHVLVKDNLCTHPIAKLPPTAPEEKVTLRIVPPAERLRLGGIYVPYTKHQRVQWFLDNLETDDA